jgi:hypothetical protein
VSDFIPRARIERRATECWHRENLQAGFDIERLLDRLDLGVLWEPIDRVKGQVVVAELVPSEGLIRLNEDLRDLLDRNLGFYRFTLGHEIGHWDLHCDPVREGGETLFRDVEHLVCRRLVFGRDDPPAEFLTARQARREYQANLYATYLLAPAHVFQAAYRVVGCDGWPATYALAERLGLSAQATLVRLSEEGLGYRDHDGTPRSGREPQQGQESLGL